MLEFQHIIQINDLAEDTSRHITRSQLWQGLELRARHPEKFNTTLQCEVSDGANHFIRRITAGDSQFTEQVVLQPETSVITNTLPGTSDINAESAALIEEPEPGSLFVRFSYRRDLEQGTDSVNVAEYLKAAYLQLDREAVALIKVLAQNENNNRTIN